MMGNKSCSGLCPISLGVALGVTNGLVKMLFAFAGWLWGYGIPMITQLTLLLPGYEPTLKGGFVGFGWGLLEGFIFGAVLALLYNFFCRCCGTAMCSKNGAGK